MLLMRKHDASSIHSFRVGGVLGNDHRKSIRALFVPRRKSFKKERKKKIFKFLMHFHPVVVCFSTVVVLPSRVDDER